MGLCVRAVTTCDRLETIWANDVILTNIEGCPADFDENGDSGEETFLMIDDVAEDALESAEPPPSGIIFSIFFS